MAIAQPVVDAIAISGRIVDARGKPVRNATVSSDAAPDVTVTTDAKGRYTLRAPVGSGLIVLADGYGAGLGTVDDDTVDDIVLIAEAEVAETITIEDEAPISTQGATRLDRATVQRIPGTGNDIMRSLQAMPGVASYPLPLGASGVVIRGSSPHDSKILIDDFEVPSLYHDIGFKSIVPAEAIDSLEYLPGGFDVAYGRASSGIVSLKTRGGSEGHGEQFEVSGNDASFLVQGTLKNGTYMLGLRRSLVDFILPLAMPDGIDLALTTVPRFYDEQMRVDFKLSTKWKLRVSSLGSDDALELYASKDKNPDKRFLNRTRFVRLTTAAQYHDGPWTANLALSGIAQQFIFERGTEQHLHVTAPAITARAEIMRTADEVGGLTQVAWRAGGETVVTHHTIDMANGPQQREGQPMTDDPMDTSRKFDGTVVTNNFAAWTNLAGNLDERIRVSTGVRVDAFTRVGDVAVQPRGELAVKISPKVTARLVAGAYARPPEHQTEVLEAHLQAERSRQLVTGVSYEPAKGVRFQGSLYYTDRSSLITRDMMTGELGNEGRGTTYGAEILGTLSRGPWFGWFAYSYSKSTRVDHPGEEARLFDYDQPHSINVAGSYRWGRWQLGLRFRAHSGLPSTPVEAAVFDSDANRYEPLFGEVNSVRADTHHQLDLRIDRKFNWGPIKMTKFIDIQNVYLNDSVVGYFYGFDYTQRAAFRQLPILPTAGLRGEF